MPVGNGNTDAARIWTTADVYAGPYVTAAPTNLTTALNTLGYSLVGLMSQDDGIKQTFSADESDKFAYGSILVRRTSIKDKVQFGFTAWEDSDIVYKLAHPGSSSTTTGGVTTRKIKARNIGLAIRSLVLELSDGSVAKRVWIPKAQVLLNGDQPLKDNEIAGYPLTVDALAYTSGGETFFYQELTNDTSATAGS